MAAKARTIAELHADYAPRLAAVTGLAVAEYQPTTSGFAGLWVMFRPVKPGTDN